MRPALILALCTLPLTAARADNPPKAEAAPLPPAIAAPQDKPFPGTIDLRITPDLDHHVFDVTETVPVPAPGPLTLLYPKWIPGTHGPEGNLAAFAGLEITANGAPVNWVRDDVDVFAFHVIAPAGAPTLKLHFQYLSPPTNREGAVLMTDRIALLQWWSNVLYPAGYYVRDITIHPSFALPDNWQYGTALDQESRSGNRITFKPVPLDVLIDSPIYAGRYFARFDLAPGAKTPVHLDAVADAPEDLAITPADLAAHRAVVTQSARNYASQHYDHFDFLVALSDETSFAGLEHHRSSENGVDSAYFTDPQKGLFWRTYLLPHEYNHSWNGKFRRPDDLWSPDYTVIPERGSLLWVYEGQTEYWGEVISARAGLQTGEQFRDFLAIAAAQLQYQAGRAWRNMQDTTNDPVINERRPLAWRDWSRAEDYYNEGMFMWLDADTLIREKTNNHASLTTFAQKFFGIDDGSFTEAVYNFNDVVTALNAVYPYDWASFLSTRLDSHPNRALLDGITRAGWKLVFTDMESALEKSAESARKAIDTNFSIGMVLTPDGSVRAVRWDSPAYHAGLSPGVTITAINGLEFGNGTALNDALKAKAPLSLLVHDGKHYRTVAVDYHDGLRYPHLERIPGTVDRLADIAAPLQ
jgi:predicted metalloprotease with PDZ domain